MTMTPQHMSDLGDRLWDARWQWAGDFNRDGVISVSDVWLGFQWIFFAPGDALILIIMRFWPSIAIFFEMNIDTLSGFWSGAMSVPVWLLALIGVNLLIDR